jgi:hypothetical protein
LKIKDKKLSLARNVNFLDSTGSRNDSLGGREIMAICQLDALADRNWK